MSNVGIFVVTTTATYFFWFLFSRIGYMVYIAAIEDREIFDGGWDHLKTECSNNERDFFSIFPISSEISIFIILASVPVISCRNLARKISSWFSNKILTSTQDAKAKIKRITSKKVSKEEGALSIAKVEGGELSLEDE